MAQKAQKWSFTEAPQLNRSQRDLTGQAGTTELKNVAKMKLMRHKCEKDCNRSRVQRFRGSRFHSRPRTGFGMRIYEKSVSFVRPNPKFGAKLAIIWDNEDF